MIQTAALIDKFQYALDNDWGYIWGTAGTLWTKEDQEKIEKTTDSDREQARKYGKKWIGHKVSDCSGLFKWAFAQLGGEMYHGSDTMYRKWCKDKGEMQKGKRSDGKSLKPGTAVFVWNGTKYSHVGLYIGGGWVIEAASTTSGVIRSKVTASKWKYWGELRGVKYGTENPAGQLPEENEKADALPTLRRGDKGPYVTQLQTALKQRGYNLGPCGIDGDFGKATEAAVKQFQRDWGLTADGIVGPKTHAMLESTPAKAITYAVTIQRLDLKTAQEICAKYKNAIMEEEQG